jgi:signal transduction histidine kinase
MPVSVTIDHRETELAFTITNPHQPVEQVSAAEAGPGFGLVGMRERIAALGGQLTAGRRHSDFQVDACVPIQTAGETG